MAPGDWLNAAINLLVGVLLGSVFHGVVELVAGGYWLIAPIMLLPAAGLFLFMVLQDKLFERLFPVGIRPANPPQAQRRKPLLRVVSLSSGFLLGVLLASLGLDGALPDLLP